MNVLLHKTLTGLVPADPATSEWYQKIRIGEAVHADFKRVRNYRFLKKYFALLNIAYDNWQPGEVDSKYGTPEKNFERFRADLTILAGHYETTIRLDGSTRIEPKSISFSKMDEQEFEDLYSRTIDVLIKYVYRQDMSPEDLDNIVNQYLTFA